MFTVLVEAKDHGEVVSLSSSTTVVIHVQDGNNHLPTISGQTVGSHLDSQILNNTAMISADHTALRAFTRMCSNHTFNL